MRHGKTELYCIALAVAVGAALRAYGVGFGLPLLSNFYIRPDESLIVQAALPLFERKGDPQFFAYPALMPELCALIYTALSKIAGDFAANPSAYFLAARWVSVIAGTVTILVVWRMAGLLCGWSWAVGAAALYAVAPLAVRDAHFGVTDTLMSLLVAMGLCTAVQYAQRSGEAPAGAPLRTSALMALAFSTKYTAALAAPALVAAVAERAGSSPWRAMRLLTPAALLAAVVFVALNPYVFLRFGESSGTVLGMFGVFYGGTSAEAAATWNAGNALAQVLRPLAYGPGSWVGLLFAALSLGWLVRNREPVPGLLTVACGTFPLLLALLPFQHPLPFRYVLPSLPGLAVLAAFAASRLARYRHAKALLGTASAVLLIWQFSASAALVRVLAREDTRTLAGAWIARELPPHLPVVLLGAPEAEPQIAESAASLERRIGYVYGLYGPQSGQVVSALYRLLLPSVKDGREVYRNPAPADVPGTRYILVLSAYPLPMIGETPIDPVRHFGTVQSVQDFNPIVGPMEGASLDGIDAFLLPMNPRGLMERPGPRLRVMVVHRTGH